MTERLFSRRAVLRTTGASFALPVLAMQEKSAVPGVSALLDGSGFVRIPPGEFDMGSRDGNADEQLIKEGWGRRRDLCLRRRCRSIPV